VLKVFIQQAVYLLDLLLGQIVPDSMACKVVVDRARLPVTMHSRPEEMAETDFVS